jgi:hypothetical protein
MVEAAAMKLNNYGTIVKIVWEDLANHRLSQIVR